MATEATPEVPRTPEAEYPPYVQSEDERRRWDLSAAIARQHFGEAGPDHVWTATRSIYRDQSVPTEAPDDGGGAEASA